MTNSIMVRVLKARVRMVVGVVVLPTDPGKKASPPKRLLIAAPADTEGLQMIMDVRAYREKPAGKESAKGTAQALWAYLQTQAGPCLG